MTQSLSQKIWYGAIVVAYKTNPLRILLIENPHRQKVSLLSGAVEAEDRGSQARAAIRELREEVGWSVNESEITPTRLLHDFVYSLDKVDRGGDRGSNAVFLLNASHLPEPHVVDSENVRPVWVSGETAVELISFDDLKPILKAALEEVKTSINITRAAPSVQ